MDGGTTSFDLAIQQARERLHRAEHLQRLQATHMQQRDTLRAEVAELERLVDKEKRDVERLQRTSLASIFSSIRGDKADRLTREQAQADDAFVRLEGHRTRLAQMELRMQAVQVELADLHGAAEDYQGALKAKEDSVQDAGGPMAAELTQIAGELGDLLAGRREHDEAVAAGTQAEHVAQAMLERLTDAKHTSTYDMFGGELFTDMIERGQLRDAERLGWELQQHLDQFSAELKDVGVVADPKVPEVHTGGFMDMWCDNVFSDWAQHDRINQSKQAVEQLCQWLRATTEHVRAQQLQIAGRCHELRARRERLLSPPA
ncbi:hypothetical protein [Flindersiella endophytica]